MGADSNSVLKKCGEILINIKLKNRKTKTYTFNCVFCDANWDQLKKFSQHLEETHLEQFIEETEDKPLIFEPEIKLEEHGDAEKKDILRNLLTNEKSAEVDDEEDVHQHQDPLEPIEFVTTTTTATATTEDDAADVKVKHEKNDESLDDHQHEDDNEDDGDDDCGIHDNDDMDYEDCTDDKIDEDVKETDKNENKRTVRPRQSKKKCKDSSDVSSDDSNDSDFIIKKEIAAQKKPLVVKVKKSYLKKAKKIKKETKKEKPVPEPKIYSESEKVLIKLLFSSFEKQRYLWNEPEKKRTADNVIAVGYEKIAHEVNTELKTNLTGELVKNRITELRIEYSYELEKQQNGQPHQIPWYSVHIQFLHRNIDALIKSRRRKRSSKNATKLEDAHLLILIEAYRKNETLWKLNNISFGVSVKREETYTAMVEDLKTNHDIHLNNESLHDYIKYIHRLYTKDREQQLKCELAERDFTPATEYFKEMSFLNESQGPFKCEICKEVIKRFETYYQHVATHTNTMPFKCSLCEMGFKKFDKYIIHAKRHLGINSFQCSVCGKGYPFKSELDWHLTSHTGDRPYLCQHCGASFRARHEYDNHVRRHEKRFRYECHICKHGFNHLHHLNDHVRSHLDIRDHVCNICGKAFTALKYLKNHKLIHDNTKRYKCLVCGKEFAQTAGLRQHRKQHKPHLSAAELKRKNEDIEGFPDVFPFLN